MSDREPSWLPGWLAATLQDAERRLKRLGRSTASWEFLQAYFVGGPLPAFGCDPVLAQRLLGREFRVAPRDRRGEGKRSAAWNRLQRHKRRNQQKLGLTGDFAFSKAAYDHPELYRQLKNDWKSVDLVLHKSAAWSEAERAAVATAFLHDLQEKMPSADPSVVELVERAFTAGYALRDYKLRQRFPRLRQEAIRPWRRNMEQRIRQERRRAAAEGGKATAGRMAAHNQLVARAYRHLQGKVRRPRCQDVLEALVDEALVEVLVVDEDYGEPLPIRKVHVDLEEGTADFVYADGREQLVQARTIDNLISRLRKNLAVRKKTDDLHGTLGAP